MIYHALEMGSILADELKDIPVRVHAGKGLLAGLEFEGPLQASKVVLKWREKGLLVVDTGRKWVKLGPPLTIEAEDIERGCKILKEAVEEVLNDVSENNNITDSNYSSISSGDSNLITTEPSTGEIS